LLPLFEKHSHELQLHHYVEEVKKVIIPEILTPSQQESIAIRWLILNARLTTGSSGKAIAECLALELFGCLTNQGKTIQQREQLHKLAEANRAWAN